MNEFLIVTLKIQQINESRHTQRVTLITKGPRNKNACKQMEMFMSKFQCLNLGSEYVSKLHFCEFAPVHKLTAKSDDSIW